MPFSRWTTNGRLPRFLASGGQQRGCLSAQRLYLRKRIDLTSSRGLRLSLSSWLPWRVSLTPRIVPWPVLAVLALPTPRWSPAQGFTTVARRPGTSSSTSRDGAGHCRAAVWLQARALPRGGGKRSGAPETVCPYRHQHGLPVPKVTKKGRGLRCSTTQSLRLRSCRRASKLGAQVPVTVKIRRGGRRMGERLRSLPEPWRQRAPRQSPAWALCQPALSRRGGLGVREPRSQSGERAGHWVW